MFLTWTWGFRGGPGEGHTSWLTTLWCESTKKIKFFIIALLKTLTVPQVPHPQRFLLGVAFFCVGRMPDGFSCSLRMQTETVPSHPRFLRAVPSPCFLRAVGIFLGSLRLQPHRRPLELVPLFLA